MGKHRCYHSNDWLCSQKQKNESKNEPPFLDGTLHGKQHSRLSANFANEMELRFLGGSDNVFAGGVVAQATSDEYSSNPAARLKKDQSHHTT
jgi:hypothetical protein